MTWASGPWLGVDFESTGVDPCRWSATTPGEVCESCEAHIDTNGKCRCS